MPNSPAAALAMIRIMMLGGVLLFGALIWFLYRNGSRVAMEPGFAVAPIALGPASLGRPGPTALAGNRRSPSPLGTARLR